MSTSTSKLNKSSSTRRYRLGGGIVLIAAIAAIPFLRRAPAGAAVAVDMGGLRVVANLDARKLYLKMGEETIETYPVAIGQPQYPTPRGNYVIRRIVWNPAWIPPERGWAKDKEPQEPGASQNPMKLVKIFFREPDYYIHGTGDIESLGDAASHGCLRMDPDDAYRVARYLMQHGGQPRDEAWYWRVLHFRSETKTVYLDNPIPMSVE
jgi:lipoprotein-anchoring transpeptidase ErfK/SrfK